MATNQWTGFHGDLLAAKALVYDPSGFSCSQPVPEPESAKPGPISVAANTVVGAPYWGMIVASVSMAHIVATARMRIFTMVTPLT